jgi:phage gp36-like protein
MSYASQQDLVDRCGEEELILLTDTTNTPPAAIDAVVVQRALDKADAEINSWIAARYVTPLSPVPGILVDKACALARYKLYRGPAPDNVRTDYTDATAWLQKVSQGLVSLGDGTAAATAPTGGTPQVSAPARMFTRDTLTDL